MSVKSKRHKSSHFQDKLAACDTWLSTTERKKVIIFTNVTKIALIAVRYLDCDVKSYIRLLFGYY